MLRPVTPAEVPRARYRHPFIACPSGDSLANIMKLFLRLHDRCEPPGLEWAILKRLPKILLLGTLVPIAVSVIARLVPVAADTDLAKRITTVDIYAFATTMTFWIAILTVAIGCVVVLVLKGPAYVADAYPLQDSPRPGKR